VAVTMETTHEDDINDECHMFAGEGIFGRALLLFYIM
jgi:hypothetical protein